jgi:hypothetical protein
MVIQGNSDDDEPSFSKKTSGIHTPGQSGIQTPFTPQTGERAKPPPSDLKEFTLNKFNTIEPFMIKQFADFKENLRIIEEKFQENL